MEAELSEIIRRKRPYASYFHFGGDQAGTEIGVVTNWLFARYDDHMKHFKSLEHRANPFDPPDVVMIDHDGRRHGIEVTEFVDRVTISAHVKSQSVDFREYREDEFRCLVAARVHAKAQIAFKDTTCVSKLLIMYSDEPAIAYGEGVQFLLRFPAVAQTAFDEVWFIIPPDVSISGTQPENPNCRIYEIKKEPNQ